MSDLAFDPEVLLAKPLMANLATICPNGPRNSPVWFLWESGALWMPGSVTSSAVRRIEKDPRVAIEIVEFRNEAGILLHLGFRGQADIRTMDERLFRRLLAKYLGPDERNWNTWFIETIARIDDPNGRLIRLKPDSTFTANVSYFRTGPNLAGP